MLFLDFFYALRQQNVPVSVREWLGLLEALTHVPLSPLSLTEFHALARMCLIKHERYFDVFDQVFAQVFAGISSLAMPETAQVPADWLIQQFERQLSATEKAQLQALGWENLLKQLQTRLCEQTEAHHGGNKWIGTGGTSPFGHGGYHPEGIRMGGHSRQRRAVKVWETRPFRHLREEGRLETRTLQIALKRLRHFATTGADEVLDLPATLHATAQHAGQLNLRFTPERHNAVKVLLFFDIGGSMDDHIHQCEALFSAARGAFKHLEMFYFHNCPYERLWRDQERRTENSLATWDVLHHYGRDYKVIIVADASMSPYEIQVSGGSVEHYNPEAGHVWLQRLCGTWPALVWLNPSPANAWEYTPSIGLIQQIIGKSRMFPLTLAGLSAAITALSQRSV